DMVINIGRLRDGDYLYIYNEIKGVREAIGKDIPLKVILENCYLNRRQKIAGSVIAKAAGADWIKTSTGFGTSGVTIDDVILMRRAVKDEIKVKAATGVNTLKDAEEFVHAGAKRLGISRLLAIATGEDNIDCAAKHNSVPDND
ncbi:MAG: deoxyribose-phosphate aldolase, partial [Clostridia bacterium]|nr:deoxyribose-phosphate aldolase [Clostridia bacterium]